MPCCFDGGAELCPLDWSDLRKRVLWIGAICDSVCLNRSDSTLWSLLEARGSRCAANGLHGGLGRRDRHTAMLWMVGGLDWPGSGPGPLVATLVLCS